MANFLIGADLEFQISGAHSQCFANFMEAHARHAPPESDSDSPCIHIYQYMYVNVHKALCWRNVILLHVIHPTFNLSDSNTHTRYTNYYTIVKIVGKHPFKSGRSYDAYSTNCRYTCQKIVDTCKYTCLLNLKLLFAMIVVTAVI